MRLLTYLAFFVIAITGLAFFAMKFPKYKRVQLDDGYGYRVVKLPNAFFVIVIAILLIAISGHRGSSYQDTGQYIYGYSYLLTDNFSEIGGMFDDWLFWRIALIVKDISGASKSWFLLVFAILTIGLIIWTFYRYSERFELSVFFFLVLGSYLVSMNAMRQCLASALMFCGYRFFINKKWFPFFILVAIAYFCHASSLIMIPIFFYCHRPAWEPLATAIVVAVALALVFVPSFMQMILSFVGDSDYASYENLHGANILRPLFFSAICLFAFINREKLHNRFPQSDILVNMLVVHTIILFAATNSFVIARLSIYTDLFVEMLIPMMTIACFEKRNRMLWVAATMIIFFAYHLYEYRSLDYYSSTLGIPF